MGRRIFLVGPMGAGKTAVGRCLARLIRCRFIDSDAEIERRTGVDIPYIFEREGEEGFRAREREVIADLTVLDEIVLATGGGAILASENRQLLRERGVVVYLHTSVQQQVERTANGRQRPLLLIADPRRKLEELMVVREPLYREVAHHVVVTDGRRAKDVAEDIAAVVGQRSGSEP